MPNAMRRRLHPLSRSERVTSLVTAIVVTVGTAVLILEALVNDGVTHKSASSDELTTERLVYVVAPRAIPTAPPRPADNSAPRPRTRSVGNATASPENPSTFPDSASLATEASASVMTSGAAVSGTSLGGEGSVNATPSRSAAGAPIASARAGFTRGPVEGAPPPPFKPLPPTQAEIDAKWRDQAFEAAAARGAGAPVRVMTTAGGVSAPLPFGGPSKKERERDRAIEAQLKVARALRQQRIDSIVAARQRRLADSLARAAGLTTQSNRPEP